MLPQSSEAAREVGAAIVDRPRRIARRDQGGAGLRGIAGERIKARARGDRVEKGATEQDRKAALLFQE